MAESLITISVVSITRSAALITMMPVLFIRSLFLKTKRLVVKATKAVCITIYVVMMIIK